MRLYPGAARGAPEAEPPVWEGPLTGLRGASVARVCPDEGGGEPPRQPRIKGGELVGRHVIRHRSRGGEEAHQREDGSDDREGLGDQQAGEAPNHPVEAGLDAVEAGVDPV